MAQTRERTPQPSDDPLYFACEHCPCCWSWQCEAGACAGCPCTDTIGFPEEW